MRRDPYNKKSIYLNWKEKTRLGVPGISKLNSEILKQYLNDMEIGVNIGGAKKGARSYLRLCANKDKIISIMKKLERLFSIHDITKVADHDLARLFTDMRNGIIKRKDGKTYKDVADFVYTFKAFWHWYQRMSDKKGYTIKDITKDLDISKSKPEWVYLSNNQFKKLCDCAKYEYKVLMVFLLDAGVRPPGEMCNIRVSDLNEDCTELNIRDQISKTFGRRIKLINSPKLLKDYIKYKSLQPDDYLFNMHYKIINQYFNRLGLKVLGPGFSKAGKPYSKLTMYDFRHNAACYWLPRYKSTSGIMYRMGWKMEKEIYYYSEFLGMRDSITENDVVIDDNKTSIEKKLDSTEKENEILKERVNTMQKELEAIKNLMTDLSKHLN